VLAPSGLFVNADKYAQTVEAHRDALSWQLNRFFDSRADCTQTLGARESCQSFLENPLRGLPHESGAVRPTPKGGDLFASQLDSSLATLAFGAAGHCNTAL
jgi:hypothetical protein